MTEIPIYEQAVTTGRPAERLAHKHGFESVVQLAEWLPPGARVLDLGAGVSPFGREVASLRSDIAWTNFDYSYHDPDILAAARKDAPDNMEFVAGDATRLAEAYEPETFDAVFSYWLFPHLSMDDRAPAEAAARAVFQITKNGGLMSVGPKTRLKGGPELAGNKAFRQKKHTHMSEDEYTEKVVRATKLPHISRYTQRVANEVATPFFGTSRYLDKSGHVPKIYHPERGEYVPALSPAGLHTAGRLTVALARGAATAWRMDRRKR